MTLVFFQPGEVKKRRGIAANGEELDATTELVMLLISIFTGRITLTDI
jgi:hypothetical protein